MALTKDEKTKIVVEYGKGETDTGSTEVQIALLTQRIHQLTDHLKAHTHDQNSKRGLLKLVGQRRRHLRYLSQKDPDAYRAILQRLGLRR